MAQNFYSEIELKCMKLPEKKIFFNRVQTSTDGTHFDRVEIPEYGPLQTVTPEPDEKRSKKDISMTFIQKHFIAILNVVLVVTWGALIGVCILLSSCTRSASVGEDTEDTANTDDVTENGTLATDSFTESSDTETRPHRLTR